MESTPDHYSLLVNDLKRKKFFDGQRSHTSASKNSQLSDRLRINFQANRPVTAAQLKQATTTVLT